jgi:hypothetical protein
VSLACRHTISCVQCDHMYTSGTGKCIHLVVVCGIQPVLTLNKPAEQQIPQLNLQMQLNPQCSPVHHQRYFNAHCTPAHLHTLILSGPVNDSPPPPPTPPPLLPPLHHPYAGSLPSQRGATGDGSEGTLIGQCIIDVGEEGEGLFGNAHWHDVSRCVLCTLACCKRAIILLMHTGML